jgi:hypothetical protein
MKILAILALILTLAVSGVVMAQETASLHAVQDVFTIADSIEGDGYNRTLCGVLMPLSDANNYNFVNQSVMSFKDKVGISEAVLNSHVFWQFNLSENSTIQDKVITAAYLQVLDTLHGCPTSYKSIYFVTNDTWNETVITEAARPSLSYKLENTTKLPL